MTKLTASSLTKADLETVVTLHEQGSETPRLYAECSRGYVEKLEAATIFRVLRHIISRFATTA